jgi:hypothetical protein
MIVLSTLRYGEKSYGSASCAVLRQLDTVHNKRCKTGTAENLGETQIDIRRIEMEPRNLETS